MSCHSNRPPSPAQNATFDPDLGIKEVLNLDHLIRNADPTQAAATAPAVDEDQVRAVIENIRDYVQSDGGDVELVKIEGFTVFVRVFGACVSCGSLDMTMTHGIQSMLQDEVDPMIQVEQIL
jgi:Fe-S cluster biogenesis protein NfuA